MGKTGYINSMSKAFSLVELSIVLVILGLLTGGILAGQSLIRAAELRSLPTQAAQYHSAIYSFRNKYMALPGDFDQATRFWGVDPDGCPSHGNWQAGKTQTCDGNNNGRIDTKPEYFRFWQQLAAAGMIEGSYSGVTGPTNSGNCNQIDHIPGTNVPALRLSRSGVGTSFIADQTPGSINYMFAGQYGNTMTMGAVINGCNPIGGLFLPEEAWNIDTKLDDGKPGMGGLVTRVSCVGDGCMPNCNDASNSAVVTAAANAQYLLTGTSRACGFYYKY